MTEKKEPPLVFHVLHTRCGCSRTLDWTLRHHMRVISIPLFKDVIPVTAYLDKPEHLNIKTRNFEYQKTEHFPGVTYHHYMEME